MNHDLENHMVINESSIYESMFKDVTPDEQDAMDALRKKVKENVRKEMYASISKQTPRGLVCQLQDVIGSIEDIDPGFNLFMHDAIERRDIKLIGMLLLRARDVYITSVVDEELGE